MTKKYPFKNLIIFENENFTIHQDWAIPISGFFILDTKKKIKSFTEFSDKESYEFMDLLVKTRKLMKERLNIEDVYIFQNEDTEHWFHLWIFPRLEWMEDFWRKIESVRPIMNYAKENMFTDYNIKIVESYVNIMRENFNK